MVAATPAAAVLLAALVATALPPGNGFGGCAGGLERSLELGARRRWGVLPCLAAQAPLNVIVVISVLVQPVAVGAPPDMPLARSAHTIIINCNYKTPHMES